MANNFDPMAGLSAEDMQYLSGQKKAFERQQAAHSMHSSDESRAVAAEEHRRAVMRSQGVAVPDELPSGPVPNGQAATVAPVNSLLSILHATPETGEGKNMTLAPAGEQFAPDWTLLKSRISKYDGIWTVAHYEFPAHAAYILGFFGKEGWDAPPETSKKRSFEVIVRDGRVFRTDPE